MRSKDAWLYAASWGSYMTSGDPGACMYGFSEDCLPQSEEHRANVLAWIADCRLWVLAHPADYAANELKQLDAFVRYMTHAPVQTLEKQLARGDHVTFQHYGEEKTGVVERISSDGAIVTLKSGRWLHRDNVKLLSQESSHVSEG